MKQRKIIQVREDKAVEWGESSEDQAHQERVKVLSESGFRKQRQFYFFQNNFLSLFLAAWGLHCCTGFSLAVARGGFSLAAARGGFSLAAVWGLLPGCGAWGRRSGWGVRASPCGGFSCC